MIQRFSSRRHQLHESFLVKRLYRAQSYDRIAGYFRSSILDVAGEALETISGPIRIVCNSNLDVRDVETARIAEYAMRKEWCGSQPEAYPSSVQTRFARLYNLLSTRKMQVKVLPMEKFGLEHGKAGVITLEDGQKTSYMGSANETFNAWKMHYELIWEDSSFEAVQWVQEEFDALWNSRFAVSLADFVIEDIGRLAQRTVIPTVEVWREDADPAAPIIETPVYRKEYGLWEHQKYFVKLVADAHKKAHGARFVLADTVGLGKTVQLALSALLISLLGDRPVLIIVPKPLLEQWQDEMKRLLDMPSAIWNGKQWIDENGIEYPIEGPEGIKKCPRRIGVISQGLIISKSEVVSYLKQMSYEVVIVDESHRARRKNLGLGRESEIADPNNLLDFLYDISIRTKSLLLATATPVQIYPIELWDLLNVLARGTQTENILGNAWSNWKRPKQALDLVMHKIELPKEDMPLWGWIRNPLPPSSEGRDFEIIRRGLNLSEDVAVPPGDAWDILKEPDRARVKRLRRDFTDKHNPFIRYTVRRTREYLEKTIDKVTGEPYLKPVKVELFGDSEAEAIRLPPYLRDAYDIAEDFCQMLSKRMKGTGFLKTLLLRRVGSTIYAGMNTAKSMIGTWEALGVEEDDEEEEQQYEEPKSLTPLELKKLQEFIDALNVNQERDPKYQVIEDLLLNRNWLQQGCIVFSQYFDSISWLATQLSEALPREPIGIYAGGQRSGVLIDGMFNKRDRESLKLMVQSGEIRLLLGTDAASEGLNLQRLGCLINLDLPWNPTRLEQRKGRIQRIGQLREVVFIYNMRYRDSVEDRVHQMLSGRLQAIHTLFGQIPDVLEDVWIDVALGQIEQAAQIIDAVPQQHPFELRYHNLEHIAWESCSKVLDIANRNRFLTQGW